MDEEIYIAGLHQGDERIFRLIFEKYHARLCYFAMGLLEDDEAAKDVVQEAYLRIWQRREHFNDLPSLKAFLYISVKNLCLNIHKHDKVIKKFARQLPDEDYEQEAMDLMIESEVLERVNHALQKLPAGCRTVLQLSYFEGLKNKDIATRLRVSINTVKTQRKRAIHLLRALLKVSPSWLLLFFMYFL